MISVDKKLRETTFFLEKMAEREQLAFGDHEEFDFYLSAFLNAARTVDYRLRHVEGDKYRNFRATWDSELTTDDQSLIKFLIDDRDVEVHERGSSRTVREMRIRVPSGIGMSYKDKSGSL